MPKRSIDHRPAQNYVVNIATGKPMKSHDIPVICEKIRFYRERVQLEQAELAKAIGVTPNAVSNWETGRSRPDINLLPSLCDALHISFYELFAIPDPTIKLSTKETRLVEQYRQLKPVYQMSVDGVISNFLETQDLESYRELRILVEYNQQLAAGISYGTEYDDPGTPVYVYRENIDTRADCIFTVNGDSMEPTYHNGDRVLVERLYNADDIHYGEIGAFADGNDLWIKEYQPDGLYSHNKKYAPLTFGSDSQIALIGRVISRLSSSDVASSDDIARFLRVHGEKEETPQPDMNQAPA